MTGGETGGSGVTGRWDRGGNPCFPERGGTVNLSTPTGGWFGAPAILAVLGFLDVLVFILNNSYHLQLCADLDPILAKKDRSICARVDIGQKGDRKNLILWM